MSTKILPGELFVVEHGAVIRTNCPKDLITDAMLHERVVNANLAAGDFLKVQCFNHEKTAILHFAEYLVSDRRTEMKRIDVSDRESRTAEHVLFSVLRVQDWQATPLGREAEAVAKAAKKAAA